MSDITKDSIASAPLEEQAAGASVLMMKVGWGLVLLGWFYALTIANGSGLVRLSLLPVICLIGSSLCVVNAGSSIRKLAWAVILAGSYFLIRAWISPVWDEAQRDLVLVSSGLMVFLAGAAVLKFAWARSMVLIAVGLGILVNVVLVAIQLGDEQFAFLRPPRGDVEGVSGTFYHRNYLAGFLEIAAPVLVALALCAGRKAWWAWVLIGGSVLMVFLSNSRSGFLTFAIGILITVIWIVAGSWGKLSLKRRVGILGGGLVASLVAGWLIFVGFEVIMQNRGAESSLAVSKQLEARLGMAGVGVEIWMQNFWWGAGAESYSYLFPRFSSGLIGSWFGDARMAHNEYVQVASDYGFVGLLALLVLVSSCGVSVFRSQGEVPKWWCAAAVGVLGAELLRAGVDFNLHLAPNLLLFAVILGGAFSGSTASRKKGHSVALAGAVLAIGGAALVACSGEVRALPQWLSYEKASLESSDRVEAELREYCVSNSEFRPGRELARVSVRRALNAGASSVAFKQAREDLGRVIARNPYDGESLSNLARLLEDEGAFKEAEILHLAAIQAVGAREQTYGVYYAFAMHFVKRGQARSESRNPGEALSFYLEAEKMLEISFQNNFERKKILKPTKSWLRKQIEFLQQARIEPVPIVLSDQIRYLEKQAQYAIFSWELK